MLYSNPFMHHFLYLVINWSLWTHYLFTKGPPPLGKKGHRSTLKSPLSHSENFVAMQYLFILYNSMYMYWGNLNQSLATHQRLKESRNSHDSTRLNWKSLHSIQPNTFFNIAKRNDSQSRCQLNYVWFDLTRCRSNQQGGANQLYER